MRQWVMCPACNGEGDLGDGREECPECKGKGMVDANDCEDDWVRYCEEDL